MNERVRRPLKFEQFLQELGGQSSNNEKSFDSLKSVLIFAAALAVFKELEPVQFEKSGERIPFVYFSSEYEKSFISSLALMIRKDITIIHPSRIQEQLEVFEEMANAGLEWMQKYMASGGDIDTHLLNLVSSANLSKSIIDDIFQEVL